VNSTDFRTVQLCPVLTCCQSVLLIQISVQTAIVAAFDGYEQHVACQLYKVNYVMKDSFPVSRIDNELDALSGAEWFNVLDLQRCYF
jgi:hypothetical protein